MLSFYSRPTFCFERVSWTAGVRQLSSYASNLSSQWVERNRGGTKVVGGLTIGGVTIGGVTIGGVTMGGVTIGGGIDIVKSVIVEGLISGEVFVTTESHVGGV